MHPDRATTTVRIAKETERKFFLTISARVILCLRMLCKEIADTMNQTIAVDSDKKNTDVKRGCIEQRGIPSIEGTIATVGKKDHRNIEAPNAITV